MVRSLARKKAFDASMNKGSKPRFALFPLLVGCLLSFQIGYIFQPSTTISENRYLSTTAPSLDFDTSLATKESFGFFDDIPNYEWQLIKNRVKSIYPNVNGGDLNALRKQDIKANIFFQDHYEPDFTCRHERRIGRLGDGGKWVCDPHRLQAKASGLEPPPCLVYSVGSNGDTSFENAVKKEIGTHCEIHSFDMANYTQVVEEAGAHFHQWGISNQNFVDRRNRVYKTLADTVKELGHVGRTIDIFKIDCEGCEWDTYPAFFNAGVELRQVLIEIHGKGNMRETKFQKIPNPAGVDFFEAMYQHGYAIFHKEVNIRFWHFGQCIEYAFVKLHRDFFEGIPNFPTLATE